MYNSVLLNGKIPKLFGTFNLFINYCCMRSRFMPFITRLVYFFLLFCLPSVLWSKHIIGGEVTYECLGLSSTNPNANSYRITMKIYRDCDPQAGGAYFDSPAAFGVYRGSYNDNDLFSSFSRSPELVTQLIPDTPNCIQNVPYACVQEGIYRFTVDLPISSTESYFIVYQRCCRNNSIVNIYDPEDIGATYYVEITPEAQVGCNTSPTFENFPPIIICKDVSLSFSHAATDLEGDILVYRFCAPERGGGMNFGGNGCNSVVPNPPCGPPFNPVSFVQPQYSPTSPMGGDPVVAIDPISGLITGTPLSVGRFVVGVCVDEFRNGVKISTIKRDFQFNVADCDPTVIAALEGGDSLAVGPNGYYLNTCDGPSIFLENKSYVLNQVQSFEWRFDFNGVPYSNTTDWSPTISFPTSGTYYGQLLLNGQGQCSDTAKITIEIFPEINAAFTYDYDTCVAGPVQFLDLSTSEGVVNKWHWQLGIPGGTSTATNPQYDFMEPGLFPVVLRVTDKNGCTDIANQFVKYFPAPPYVIIRPDRATACAPRTVAFNNLSSPIDDTYKIVWDYGDGSRDTGVLSPTHIYDDPGTYTVSVGIVSPIGCIIGDTFTNLVQLYAPPVADFAFSPTKVDIFNPRVELKDLSVDADRWRWELNGQFLTNDQSPPMLEFRDTGLVEVHLLVTHPEGCQDSITRYIEVEPRVQWFMPNAFSPNGDGQNDEFVGTGLMYGATEFSMAIWNRWGEMVFETNNPTEGWNGRAQQTGGISPAGVYTYQVYFKGPRGEKYEYKGFATLVR